MPFVCLVQVSPLLSSMAVATAWLAAMRLFRFFHAETHCFLLVRPTPSWYVQHMWHSTIVPCDNFVHITNTKAETQLVKGKFYFFIYEMKIVSDWSGVISISC